jgi:hypothetical protein
MTSTGKTYFVREVTYSKFAPDSERYLEFEVMDIGGELCDFPVRAHDELPAHYDKSTHGEVETMERHVG